MGSGEIGVLLETVYPELRRFAFSITAGDMRRGLTSYARRRLAEKRNVTLRVEPDRRAWRTFCLRLVDGLSADETAPPPGVSTATAERDWRFARPWLYGEIARG